MNLRSLAGNGGGDGGGGGAQVWINLAPRPERLWRNRCMSEIAQHNGLFVQCVFFLSPSLNCQTKRRVAQWQQNAHTHKDKLVQEIYSDNTQLFLRK